MNLRGLALATLTSLALLIVAAPAVAEPPPEGEPGWSSLPLGLRLIPGAVGFTGACSGPAGSVWVVGSVTGTDPTVAARIARVSLSDGAILKSWGYSHAGKGFRPQAVASDASGDLYVTGRAGGDWLTVKFTRTGGIAWRRAYDSGGGGDVPHAMAVSGDGSVVVCGMRPGPGGGDALVVTYSPMGVMRWRRTLRTSGGDVFRAAGIDVSRNVYVAGSMATTDATDGQGVVRSYSAAGRFLWERSGQVAGKSTELQALVVRGALVTVAGSAGSETAARIVTARYRTNATGGKVWGFQILDGYPGGCSLGGLAVDGGGHAIITGAAYDVGLPPLDSPIVCRLRGDGTTQWRRAFVNPAWPHDGTFDSVAVDNAGRIYAGGGIFVGRSAGSAVLVRYAAGGTPGPMWTTSGTGDGPCTFEQVLVLSDTQVLGAGTVTGSGGRRAGVYRAGTALP
jgi:hypothetical protein